MGIPLTKGWSAVLALLEARAGSFEGMGDLGVSLRRPLVGVEGAAAATIDEAAGGLLVLRLAVLTGGPDPKIPESPKRLTRRERGVTVAAAVVGVEPLAVAPLSAFASAFCVWLRLLR